VDRVQWVSLLSAELVFVLTRAQDILVVCKARKQRTAGEKGRVDAGLRRGLSIEFLVFVPASACLVLLLSPLFLERVAGSADRSAVYALLGVVSYGFPFTGLKRVVTTMALRTLRDFAAITAEPVKAEVLVEVSREDRAP
jgi:hypothetical protein